MPEALATSKRKFYKLLDTLTPNVPAPAGSSSRQEPQLKRLRPSASRTSLGSLGNAYAARREQPPKDLPYFSPWSQETFLARLKTFAPVTAWYPKPETINEVRWAARGWECVGVNTVGCRGCGKRVAVSMTRLKVVEDDDDDHDGQEFETRLSQRYSDLVVQGHAPNCLWRQAGCKQDIYRLPVVRTAVWQRDLREAYQSLLAIGPSISALEYKTSDDDMTKLFHTLPAQMFDDTGTETTKLDAFRIAMHGWRGVVEAKTPLLFCPACFQRVGLWMYQPGYERPVYDVAEQEQARLDLVEMHREHCPWRNGESQCATGEYAGRPAWEVLLRVVSRYADEHRRRSGSGPVERPKSLDLSREDVQRLDMERVTKLKRLKKVLGIKERPRSVHLA